MRPIEPRLMATENDAAVLAEQRHVAPVGQDGSRAQRALVLGARPWEHGRMIYDRIDAVPVKRPLNHSIENRDGLEGRRPPPPPYCFEWGLTCRRQTPGVPHTWRQSDTPTLYRS